MRPKPFRGASDDSRLLTDLVSAIKSEKPVRGSVSPQWTRILDDLGRLVHNYPEHANSDPLVSAIVSLAAEFSDSTALQIIGDCRAIGIGAAHGLWFSAIALKFEHLTNYISSLDTFKEGIDARAEPRLFLTQQYDHFKKRMLRRLSGQTRLDLGTLENVAYLFIDGGISCKTVDTRVPHGPKHDFISDIGFVYARPAASQKFQPGFDPALLSTDDGQGDRCFEEARLQARGIDYVALRRQRDQSEPLERKKAPLTAVEDDPVVPRGILKRPDAKPGSSTGVRFQRSSAAPAPTYEKKRSPVSPPRSGLIPGQTIIIQSEHYTVEKAIGGSSFLGIAKVGGHKIVVKAQNPRRPQFIPENDELFCLPIIESADYFATTFFEFGTFQDFLSVCHQREHGVPEPVAWFTLLQLVRIIRNLENSWVSHGAIAAETLLNRFSKDELPKAFDINGRWKDDGFSLCRCDQLVQAHEFDGSPDRRAILNLFCLLALKSELASRIPPLPRRWKNQDLWSGAFQTLQSARPLDPLISQLVDELSKSALALRSWKARINTAIYEMFNATD
jgi:hypothetical protein